MDTVNLENIIKSFFLGIFLGIILQFYNPTDMLMSYKVLTVLASGSMGFIIGFITEWLTSILPISIANARMYFFLNNLIALLVATCLMVGLFILSGSEMENRSDFLPILLIVLGIICMANLFDYMMFRRAQTKLKTFKAFIKDK